MPALSKLEPERHAAAMTLKEVAAFFHKGERWLKDWLRSHPDCYYKAGRTRLFDAADIERIKQRLTAVARGRAWTNTD